MISAIFTNFWFFFVRIVMISLTIEYLTILQIFWVFKVPQKKIFLPFSQNWEYFAKDKSCLLWFYSHFQVFIDFYQKLFEKMTKIREPFFAHFLNFLRKYCFKFIGNHSVIYFKAILSISINSSEKNTKTRKIDFSHKQRCFDPQKSAKCSVSFCGDRRYHAL